MKLLAEISEKSLGLGDIHANLGGTYQLRKSARAIVLNEEGKMATQYLQNYAFHKLPGGGVDPGETVEEGMRREVLEEVGCDCEIIRPIGVTFEYRNLFDLLHISYCYACRVVGEIGETQLEPNEIEEGQITLWLDPGEVLEKMKKDQPKKTEGLFILKREICFLEDFLAGS